jgi:hypothetical protein
MECSNKNIQRTLKLNKPCQALTEYVFQDYPHLLKKNTVSIQHFVACGVYGCVFILDMYDTSHTMKETIAMKLYQISDNQPLSNIMNEVNYGILMHKLGIGILLIKPWFLSEPYLIINKTHVAVFMTKINMTLTAFIKQDLQRHHEKYIIQNLSRIFITLYNNMLCHCDLHDNNISIDTEKNILLFDFGESRQFNQKHYYVVSDISKITDSLNVITRKSKYGKYFLFKLIHVINFELFPPCYFPTFYIGRSLYDFNTVNTVTFDHEITQSYVPLTELMTTPHTFYHLLTHYYTTTYKPHLKNFILFICQYMPLSNNTNSFDDLECIVTSSNELVLINHHPYQGTPKDYAEIVLKSRLCSQSYHFQILKQKLYDLDNFIYALTQEMYLIVFTHTLSMA